MPQIALTIAGVGGQGSILAGIILGTAAVKYDKKYAIQTQAYSSELRGGFAATWLIISDESVLFPRVISPDILIAQAQDSIWRFSGHLKPGGTVLVDTDMVRELPEEIGERYGVQATSIARNRLKVPIVANIIMLGALCKINGIVSRDALEKAIVESVPKGKDMLNLEAFQSGYESVKSF